jgi:hypothetical protein
MLNLASRPDENDSSFIFLVPLNPIFFYFSTVINLFSLGITSPMIADS